MSQVINDVLILIIDNVIDGGQKEYESRVRSTQAFARLVLSISPANDDGTNILREAFKVTPSAIPPMADYLSLIRVVRWTGVLRTCFAHMRNTMKVLRCLYPYSQDFTYYLESLGEDCLTRAICLHRLSNVVELEIQPTGIVEFLHKASEISSLKRIFIINDFSDQRKAVYLLAICLVKAIQYHHGSEQVQDCRIYRRLMTTHSESRFDLHSELELLLPLPKGLKNLPTKDSPIQIADRSLAKLETLAIHARDKPEWKKICLSYPNRSPGYIFQRCRSLTKLSLEIVPELLDDPDLFAWAVQEAHDRAADRPVPPMVTLENLTLYVKALDVRDARKLIKDASIGFRRSLRWLHVSFESNNKAHGVSDDTDHDHDNGDDSDNDGDEGGGDVEGSPPVEHRFVQDRIRTLPRLTRFFFIANKPSLFDPRLLQFSRNLVNLTVRLNCPDGTSYLPRSWPPLELPKLTSLALAGVATRAFDPTSLMSMPCLKSLSLAETSTDSSSGEVLWMERWTWDWYLPNLTFLDVRCAKEGWFSLRILRGCPKLEQLVVETVAKSLLPVRSDLGEESDCFKTVEELHLEGQCELFVSDLQYLLQQVFPCLRKLELPVNDEVMVRQVIAGTQNHPTLRHVLFPKFDKFEKYLREMGLWNIPKPGTVRGRHVQYVVKYSPYSYHE
ncbi:hypothetical protein BGZ73_000386 [Actinomortierella ambigua]|nr:hypothetical protein BGZ73_000386 [Actinomortierella ambigua]